MNIRDVKRDEAIQLSCVSAPWIASLALAMTVQTDCACAMSAKSSPASAVSSPYRGSTVKLPKVSFGMLRGEDKTSSRW